MTKREEAAMKFAKQYSIPVIDNKVMMGFLAGAAWEAEHGDIAQKTIEWVLGLLRSEVIATAPTDGRYDHRWAHLNFTEQWLTEKLKETGK